MKSRLVKVYGKLPNQKVELQKIELSLLDEIKSEMIEANSSAIEAVDLVYKAIPLAEKALPLNEKLLDKLFRTMDSAIELGADDVVSELSPKIDLVEDNIRVINNLINSLNSF